MKSEKLLAGIAAARDSRSGPAPVAIAPETPMVEDGLVLSEVFEKPLSFFRLNPENEVYRRLKTEQDYADLEAAIRETGTIEPLEAMPDGLLLKGESRLIVAGRMGLDRLPVRIVLSPLSPAEQRNRLWLDNLARFELDEATKLWMYAQIWPGYFRRGDDTASPPTKAAIAKATGKSERQVARDRALVEKADEIAASEGREAGPEDVRQARSEKAAKRREKPSAAPEAPAIVRVRLVVERLRREAAEEVDRMGPSAQILGYAADMIEEALK